MLTSSKDTLFNKHKQMILAKTRKATEINPELPSRRKKKKKVSNDPDAILPTVLRPRNTDNPLFQDDNAASLHQPGNSSVVDKLEKYDLDYQPPRYVTVGKSCKKLGNFSISESDCRKADRRLTSIRQQAELQRSTAGEKNISAFPATVSKERTISISAKSFKKI